MPDSETNLATHPHELAEAMPIIVWTHDESGVATYFNRRWTDYTGLSLDETLRAGTESVVHPDDRAGVVDRFVAARDSGQSFQASYRLRARDGSYRWHDAQVVPLRSAGGKVTLWVGTATDIEEQRRVFDEQRYLVQASTVLGASLDLQHTLSTVAALVVPTLADWCSIDLLGETGVLERLAVAHVDPAKVSLAWDLWAKFPPRPSDPQGAYAVMRTRTPELFEEITDELLVAAVSDPQALELCRGLGLRSSISVPLVARERVLGVLALVTAESGKIYRARDVVFAEEVARRISTAIDNARLYEDAKRARAAAEALAADVLEQSRAVEAELLQMRAERDAARAEAEEARQRRSAESS